ncbi:acylphosphatase-1 isoform X1 [Alligator mississippiensis]|uniref:acylphosphatase-1 isoform X1 n=2 Tax=Alligator mississippiensis TaxID=8496 RepID=UPI0003D0D283|nr:acylphosphatase-1 isoform X1 [Alligator mississippiensis]
MAPAGGGWGWLLTLCAVLVCQAGAAMDSLVSVDYEIFGKVQGVFFRKHTQAEGRQLGLVGWVRNTERGTVQGQVQGPAAAVRQLQQWLRDTGSPKSRIDRAEFRNEKKVATLQYEDFLIRK